MCDRVPCWSTDKKMFDSWDQGAHVVEREKVTQLVGEFRSVVGLSEVDAWRSAFTALAHHRGWSIARIGRYLGISRQRVVQRIEKLHQYRENPGMPMLADLLENSTANGASGGPDLPVAFELSSWEDREFAFGVLEQVAA